MPRLSIWLIRAALFYLLLGFTFGALILIQKGTNLFPTVWQLLPLHIEFLLFGWTLQLIMGTAFWILPRFAQEPKRGNETFVGAAFGLLNLGLVLVVGSVVAPGAFGLFLLGRLAEFVGVGVFVLNIWPRVKSFGN